MTTYTQGDINSARNLGPNPHRGNWERLGITDLGNAYRNACQARLDSEQLVSGSFVYGEGLTESWNVARDAYFARLDELETAITPASA